MNQKFIDSIEPYADELYTEEELEAVEEHIRRFFGDYTHVFHEVMSPDIHVDICVIPPGPQRDYYTLVTLGMGAHIMDVPPDVPDNLRRAELIITLPSDWRLASEEERWFWPMRLIKTAARLPVESDTWLGDGHTIDNGGSFCRETELCGALIVWAQCGTDNPYACFLPGGPVNFYQIIPLHKRELLFKKMHGADALIKYSLSDVSHVVDMKRPDTCAGWNESDDISDILMQPDDTDDMEDTCDMDELDELLQLAGIDELRELENRPVQDMVLDDAEWHIDSLHEKKLPVDEINAYNHIAIYMRWCMENDLMSGPFFFRHVNVIDDINENGSEAQTDLRAFIRDSDDIRGCLIDPYFNETGSAFAQYYYAYDQQVCFPADVDSYAERYVIEHYGRERFESGEFKNEPYLFVPYTEEYYQSMKKTIDRRFIQWRASYAGMKTERLQ